MLLRGHRHLHNGQRGFSCNQLTKQTKSKLRWLHGTATARSEMGSRQMVHGSGRTWPFVSIHGLAIAPSRGVGGEGQREKELAESPVEVEDIPPVASEVQWRS